MLCFSPTQPLLFVFLRRGALRDQTTKRTAAQRTSGHFRTNLLLRRELSSKGDNEVYRRERSKKIELRVITVSEQRITASH